MHWVNHLKNPLLTSSSTDFIIFVNLELTILCYDNISVLYIVATGDFVEPIYLQILFCLTPFSIFCVISYLSFKLKDSSFRLLVLNVTKYNNVCYHKRQKTTAIIRTYSKQRTIS